MQSIVKLTVTNGKMKEKEFAFDRPKECLVGRSEDCDIKVPDNYDNLDVSRHHCLLHIDPPSIYVSDLVSKNGTFVNDMEIPSSYGDEMIELSNEDQIRLGHVVMQVHIVEQNTDERLTSMMMG